MTSDELKVVLDSHQKWLSNSGGDRAKLQETNLRDVDLHGVNLSEADLRIADFTGANLRGANLKGANLAGADLRTVNLQEANLTGATLCNVHLSGSNLQYANLHSANLYGAQLCYSNLYGANLRNADLTNANLYRVDLGNVDLYSANLIGADLSEISVNEDTRFFFSLCPAEGSFIAYKTVAGRLIVVLEIPADAKRSNATTYKCRANKAKVLRIEYEDGTPADVTSVHSKHDTNFVYTIGKTVEVKDFDEDRWNECTTGIHFFLNREIATIY